MRAIIFDLDDTLYPEMDFVRSGFRVCADFLASRYEMDPDMVVGRMLEFEKKNGRGRVFDNLLMQHGMHSDDMVSLLVYLYRSHRPVIRPYDETLVVLEKLKSMGLLLGLVTDGMASVQRGKVAALGIAQYFDAIVYTDEIGKDFWKPSNVPFIIALELLNVAAPAAVYVGDNVKKDFLAPNAIGMMTVQVKRDIDAPDAPDVPDTTEDAGWARFVVSDLTGLIGLAQKWTA
jgi:putative hydrolase of the HAD superfamily